ncbi:asparagine synthase-related protein [Coxiella-like endosymbiont]|uniref:asparagine synthase-related protein n=1 Tax=Coxiella-like endosymbiont TaxID=1592897 RepID=UPI00272A7DDB|nr:asparagine synthase-related protein [Coxiella-like endosymbiont]
MLSQVIYQMDCPVGDALIIAFYKLAKLSSCDVKVVISDEGSNKIFIGYQFHKVKILLE